MASSIRRKNGAREDILTKNFPLLFRPSLQTHFMLAPRSNTFWNTGVPRTTSPQIPSGASSILASSINNGGLETTFYENPNIKTGYSQSYNLTLQRELGFFVYRGSCVRWLL